MSPERRPTACSSPSTRPPPPRRATCRPGVPSIRSRTWRRTIPACSSTSSLTRPRYISTVHRQSILRSLLIGGRARRGGARASSCATGSPTAASWPSRSRSRCSLALVLMYFSGLSAERACTLGGIVAGHRHAGRQLDHRAREHLPPARPRHLGTPCGGAGRQADHRRRGCLHADHHLRVPARYLHDRAREPDARALCPHDRLRPHGVARGGPHPCAEPLGLRVQELQAAQGGLVRAPQGRLRTLPLLLPEA